MAVAFVTVFALDFALIPDHGGLGASIASAASYTLGGAGGGGDLRAHARARAPSDLIPRPERRARRCERNVMARFRPARPAPGE